MIPQRNAEYEQKRRYLEERYKIVVVPASLILNILNWCKLPLGYYALPVTDQLPEGCVITSVYTEWSDNSLRLKVVHESFPRHLFQAEVEHIHFSDEQIFVRPEGQNLLVQPAVDQFKSNRH